MRQVALLRDCLVEILTYLRGPLGVGGSKQPPNLLEVVGLLDV
jgi:hypothetical protein